MKNILWILLIVLSSCHSIQPGDSLNKEDLARIKELGLLGENETIVQFYSTSSNRESGNFYTNKRVASYWQDEARDHNNSVEFAFYKDIDTLQRVSSVGLTYAPYMNVVRKDSSTFKVYFEGNKEELISTFEAIEKSWKQSH